MLLIALFIASESIWGTDFSSKSPDGLREIRVQTRACFADCVLRITAHQGWGSTTLLQGNDCYFQIGHVTWVGQVAMIHIPSSTCQGFHLAYNFATGRQVDPKPYEAALRDDVQRTWAVTPKELEPCNGDVLKWMNYHSPCMYQQGFRALKEFRERHPR